MKNVSIFLLSVLLAVVPCFAAQGSPQVAEQNNSLESVEWEDLTRKMESLYLKGDIKGAIKIGNKYKKVAEESEDVDSRSYAKLLEKLGGYNVVFGDLNKAENLLKSALIIGKKSGFSSLQIARIQNKICAVFINMEKFAEAEEWLKFISRSLNQTQNKDDLIFCGFLNSMAMLEANYYKNNGNALKLLNKSLSIIQQSAAADKDVGEAKILFNIAQIYVNIGDNKKAYKILKKSLFILEKKNKKIFPDMARSYYLMGRLSRSLYSYADAENYYKKAIYVVENVLNKENLILGKIYNDIAILNGLQKNYNKAVEYFKKAIDFNARILGEKTSENIVLTNNLSFLYYQKKQYVNALKENDLSLSLCKSNNCESDAVFFDILDTRLQILRKMGKNEEALKYENLIKKYSNGNYN